MGLRKRRDRFATPSGATAEAEAAAGTSSSNRQPRDQRQLESDGQHDHPDEAPSGPCTGLRSPPAVHGSEVAAVRTVSSGTFRGRHSVLPQLAREHRLTAEPAAGNRPWRRRRRTRARRSRRPHGPCARLPARPGADRAAGSPGGIKRLCRRNRGAQRPREAWPEARAMTARRAAGARGREAGSGSRCRNHRGRSARAQFTRAAASDR